MLQRRGTLEVIVGPMFSGKTTELIRRVLEARSNGDRVGVFKPRIDTRHLKEAVVSHDGIEVEATWVGPDWETPFAAGLTVVALDEIQFFSTDTIPHIMKAVRHGVRVVVAGLDLTFREEPFGPVGALCTLADDVTKLRALCTQCGQPATRTHRIVAEQSTILPGGSESYEPRCVGCFRPDGGGP